MAVKIVTDSLGDIPAEIVKNLDITVIPIHVLFGTESFQDGVDLTPEQFFKKMNSTKVMPTTSVPALGTFIQTYEKVLQCTDEIIVMTISHKLSATYETACRAAEMIKQKGRIKVIDTLQVIMGEGLPVIQAAKAAKEGNRFEDILKQIQNNLQRIESRMAFDTLEYLKRGGRIGAGQAFLGSLLKINPILGLKDGEVFPLSRERSRVKALDALFNFVNGYSNIEAIAVEDATTPDEAEIFVKRLKDKFGNKPIYRSKVSAVIEVHVGPNVIAVSVLGDKKV
jgi:DegV family protein with EDD domain